MAESSETPFLTVLEHWRHQAFDRTTPPAAGLEDLPPDLAARVSTLDEAYQALFLAWYPLLRVQLDSRPRVLEQLVELVTTDRASSPDEFELALAFTAWAAENPTILDAEIKLTPQGVEDMQELLQRDESARVLMHRLDEHADAEDEEAEEQDDGLASDHADRLDRLEALWKLEVVPWQAIDLWFIVNDDANPLFDRDATTRRAPLLHTILTRLPETFTIADLRRWSGEPELIAQAVIALEQADIVEREGLFPACVWRKIRSLDELRGLDE